MYSIDWEMLMRSNLLMLCNTCMRIWDSLRESIGISIELWGKLGCVRMLNMSFIIGLIRGRLGKGLELVYGHPDGESGSSS